MFGRVISIAAAAALFPAITAVSAQDTKPAAPSPEAKPVSPPSNAGPPPATAFAQLPFIEAPSLSPDGTRIAARIAVQGKMRLAIIPLADTSKLKLLDPGDFDGSPWTWLLFTSKSLPFVKDAIWPGLTVPGTYEAIFKRAATLSRWRRAATISETDVTIGSRIRSSPR